MPGGSKKTGRPPVYNPEEHPPAARLLTGNGKTKTELAQEFGVCRDTITDWCTRHPEFSAAIKLGLEDAVETSAASLFKRANGYSHPAVKILTVSGGTGMGSTVEEIPFTQHYPPDTEALKFFLTNRSPKEWKNKNTTEHEVGPGLAALLTEADARVNGAQK